MAEARVVPEGLVLSLIGPSDEQVLEQIELRERKNPDSKISSDKPDDAKGKEEDCPNLTMGPPVFKNSKTSEANKKMSALELRRVASWGREDAAAAKAFSLFDIDSDGTINVSELYNLAEKMGKDVSNEVVQKIIKDCDMDGDASLNLEEFKDFFHRFTKARLEQHRKEADLIREKVDIDVKVSSSTKCRHTCVGALETACCVHYKHLILLASMAVMAAMLPLFGAAYQPNLTEINNYVYAIIWSQFYALYPTWVIVCYYYAFPTRQPIWVLVILASFYFILGFANGAAMGCQNAFFWASYPAPVLAPHGYRWWRTGAIIIGSSVNFLMLILFSGPIIYKGIFGFSIFIMFLIPTMPIMTYHFGSIVGSLLMILILLSSIVAVRITECMRSKGRGKRIGGSHAYTALMATMLPMVVQGFGLLVLYIYLGLTSTFMSVAFLLVFTAIKLQVRDILAITVSSALPDDITTVVFMFYAIFSLQYISELMYLRSGYNWVKFGIMLTLKIIMGTMTKGGFMIRGIKHMQHRVRKRQNKYDDAEDNFSKKTCCDHMGPKCLCVSHQFVKIVKSFLSNTSGATLHEFSGMSEQQRMVQGTVVVFTLISMSNLSSLACNLGSILVLLIEKAMPPSDRLWFIGAKEEDFWWTLFSFLLVLAANIFIIFISSWSKYVRWTQLQVLFSFSQLTPHALIRSKSQAVRKAKAQFLLKLHRSRSGSSKISRRNSMDSAETTSRASSDVLMVDAEQYGKKLYMLERQMFRKHFWLMLLITIYVTFNCASYGVDKSYMTYIQKRHRAFPCNWTLAFNGTKPVPPGQYGWSNWPSVCGTGALPNLNCTSDCIAEYPNSSYPNCVLYD